MLYFFLEGNSVKVIDEDKEIVTSLSFDGPTIYEYPRQVFAKSGKGFRKPRFLNRKRKLILGMIKSLYKGLKIPTEILLA